MDFKKWKGECSKYGAQKELSGHGLDNIIKDTGLALKERSDGLQQILLSRTQSLDGALKNYLDNIEKAFIRANLRSVENIPIQIRSDQAKSPASTSRCLLSKKLKA